MLYHLLLPLSSEYAIFNVFRYITFRTGASIMTALLISFFVGPKFIAWLKKIQKSGQPIRDDGPASHLITKVGTPTMGGVLILIAVSLSTLLWSRLDDPFVWIVLFVTLGFGIVGAIDDYTKLTQKSSKGISGKVKLLGQLAISIVAALAISYFSKPEIADIVYLPFFKDLFINLGYFFIIWTVFILVGASNAVNLTDGLDGLAIVPIMLTAMSFCLISYLVGNQVFATYLQLNFIPGSGELAVFCGALIGAGLGFLWFNAPPAMIFMGDTGSLAIGGALGAISVITKHEIVLAIVGGLFVIETVSVILQVGYFKLTRKRIFLMAPIHHHFEKKGWAESTIVIRFWIIATIFALIGLSTLKLR